jgi:taurine dioxygenase
MPDVSARSERPFEIMPSGQACGATVVGIDLSKRLDPETVTELRRAWLAHHVLSFPDQAMSDDDLERFTQYFGPFGDDPFIAPIAGRDHIIEIRRNADESAPLFAENWHSDWSFQAVPPSGTCLLSLAIPPAGGDTLFANQHLALESMTDDWRSRVADKIVVHSARGGYAPDGFYGLGDQRKGRSMAIRPSQEAMRTQRHALVRAHPETGRLGLFGCFGYIIAVDGMDDDAGRELLIELLRWQGDEQFQYRHEWRPNMLVMWDNRSVLHRATGGYDGHDRVLHRTTIAGAPLP